LFYRHGQSVAEVARSLDLAEEAVRQRLSRGRSLLREELARLVETTLTRTGPTRVFTAAVLAVLPAVMPQGAEAAVVESVAAGTGSAVAKGALGGAGKAAILGPAVGLLIGLLSAKAAASTGRSPEERACIHRHIRRMTLFCFAMSIALVLAFSQVEGFAASPIWVAFGLLAWMAVLVATVTWISSRMHHDVLRIRAATGTDDEAQGEALAEKGLKLGGPLVYESKLRFLGLPLLAVNCSGTDAGSFRTRRAVGWIALGDVAVSPLVAIGGFAFAPLAVGAVTVGLFSMSLWGAALGVLAFGTVAVGWWAFGLGALGWEAAAGGAVAARDYAVGAIAHAGEANTPVATEWFASQWWFTPVVLFLYFMHVAILLGILALLGWVLWRLWQRRGAPR
jgi:hypothetical protein